MVVSSLLWAQTLIHAALTRMHWLLSNIAHISPPLHVLKHCIESNASCEASSRSVVVTLLSFSLKSNVSIAVSVHSHSLPIFILAIDIFPLARAVSLWVDRHTHTLEERKKKKTLEDVTWNPKNKKETPELEKKNNSGREPANRRTSTLSQEKQPPPPAPPSPQPATALDCGRSPHWLYLASSRWPSDFPSPTGSSYYHVFFGLLVCEL